MATADRRVYLIVGLLSGAALAHEVLLLRLFSIAHWPDVAHMVISLALLGGGASGTLIALAQDRLLGNFPKILPTCGALFGLSTVICTVIAMRLPLNAEEFAWDLGQWMMLASMYVLLGIPFLCAATGIGLALVRAGDQPGPVYAADLVGAGLGSLSVLLLLQVQHPGRSLALIGAVGLLSGAIAWQVLRSGARSGFWILLLFAAVVAVTPEEVLEPRMTEFKPLSQYLRIPGARVVAERSGLESFITAVENDRVPLRHAPGMTFGASREPPPQIAVFRDGGDLQAISRASGPGDVLFLAASPAHLSYAVRSPRSALVLEAGTGEEVQRALLAGVDSVTALEADAELVALVRDEFDQYSGGLYRRPEVRLEISAPRQLPEGRSKFDLIVRSLPPLGGGQRVLAPAYALTVEGVEAFMGRLTEDGMLAFNTWIDLPPRQNLRLLSTAVRALRESGIADPARHLAMFRGWQTAVLLVSAKPFSKSDIHGLRRTALTLYLDAVHFPDVGEEETNRHHQLADDWFRRGAVAILASDTETERYSREYPFRIDPVTDARPYPNYDGRWGTFFRALSLKNSGGLALASPGLLVLLATLAQATVLAGLIILLPMTLSRRARSAFAPGAPRLATVGYFTAIGVAFMFLEIVAIQRALLLIGRPTYAVATVIAGFLVFAGLGAIASRRLSKITGPYPLTSIALAIVVAAVVPMAAENLLPHILGWPLWGRLLATLVINAPLAFLLGMPFPAGLALLAKRAPALRPWAWGINGCASVVGAILAALVAIELGLDVATLIAMILYPAAAMARLD